MLTAAGREEARANGHRRPNPFAEADNEAAGPDLRLLLGQLHDATRQVGRTGTEDQIDAAAQILSGARRSMYLLLAYEPAGAED
jgi:ABC-type transporter Mla subunit MlaD